MSEYSEDEMLMLSGIQHFVFCRRQWALIHIYGEWKENALTLEGQWLHRNADDASLTRVRDGIVEIHRVAIASYKLGLRGFCDVVELLPVCNNPLGAAKWAGLDGLYRILPVEYKHGVEKVGDEDLLQLCAQAIRLEDANNTKIDSGEIYYGKSRHRLKVGFTEELRNRTFEIAGQMHKIYKNPIRQPIEYSKKCDSCSMKEICMPRGELKHSKLDSYLEILSQDEETS